MFTSAINLSSIYLLLSVISQTNSFVILPQGGNVLGRTIPISSRLSSTTAIAQGTELNSGEQINGEVEKTTETAAANIPEEKRNKPNNNFRNRQTTPRINNQEKYGVSLDLPKTFIKCGRCSTCFAIQPEDLGNGKGWYVVYKTHRAFHLKNSC